MTENSDFVIEEMPDRDITILRVHGALEFDKRGVFSEHVEKLLASSNAKIVIDLTSVEKLFSVFLGSLVDVHQRAQDGGKVLSVLASPKVIKLLKQVNLDSILTIIPAPEK
ncbi:MAG: STAS domain-containing protein [Planctomycetota bacterium]|jgi:anti-anti-sigma factor